MSVPKANTELGEASGGGVVLENGRVELVHGSDACPGVELSPSDPSIDEPNGKSHEMNELQPDNSTIDTTIHPDTSSLTAKPSLILPPPPNDVLRVKSVEIVPPELRPDIDDEIFDENKHVRDIDEHVPLRDAFQSRQHLAAFLTLNHNFHIFVIFMVMMDVIIVLIELILDLELLKSNECRSDSDCPTSSRLNITDMRFVQDCSFNRTLDHCIYFDGKHRCATADMHHDVDPAEVVHYIGLAVLSYFNLEILVKLFALDIKFFKHKLEVFDAVVVITSLVLDVTIGGEGARESVSLLILLRLWRVTRIFNGITLAVEEREKEKRHKIKHEKQLALKDVARLQKIIHELKAEIHDWRDRAHVAPTTKGFVHDKDTTRISTPGTADTTRSSSRQSIKSGKSQHILAESEQTPL